MRRSSMRTSAAVVGFALAGAVIVLVLGSLSRTGPDSAGEPSVESAAQPRERVAARAGRDDASTSDLVGSLPTDDVPVASEERHPHAEALRHPSESYRITSLIAVIQERGYVCRSVLSAAPGTDDMSAWRVSCEDAHAYFVSEDDSGNLRVEPIPFFETPRINVTPLPPQDRFRLPQPLE